MNKYTPVQLRDMARLTLAAKECTDFRYTELLMRIVVSTGWSPRAVADRIQQLAR